MADKKVVDVKGAKVVKAEEVKVEAKVEETKEKKAPGRKVELEPGQVGAKYIAEKVTEKLGREFTPFQVREFMRHNVRNMEDQKGQTYRFSQEEADKFVNTIVERANAPRAAAPGAKKAKAEKAEKKETSTVVEDLSEVDSAIEELDDAVDLEEGDDII